MSETFNLRGAEATLREQNKTALYSNIFDTCQSMKQKVQDLMTGKIKRAVTVFDDPNVKGKQLRVIHQVEDGVLRTTFWMDDSNIWRHCEQKRKQFDEYRKHAATTGSEHMFREYYMSSWLLEVYILFKYHIDLRDSECLHPGTPEFRKVSWIIDNDDFAKRYKLTTYCESHGIANPFNTIKVEMSGLDLSKIINTDVAPQSESKIILES
jgi:hypothetical protein